MPITVTCPSCQVRLNVADDRAGKQIDCPRCDASLTIPTTSAAASRAPGRAPPPVPQQQPMSLPSIDLDEPAALPPPMPPRRSAPPLPPRPRRDPPTELEPVERHHPTASATPAQRAKLWMIVAGGAGVVLVLVVGAALAVRAFRKPVEETVSPAPAQPLSGEQVYQRLIRSTALIESPNGTGSGFVVDADKKLVVTNFHVVGAREQRVVVIFPIYDAKNQLITDAGEYKRRAREVAIEGEILAREVGCDLALIRIDRLPEKIAAAPMTTYPAPTGAKVFSVGGSGVSDNLLWRLTEGSVRGRAQRKAEADFGTVDCMILETSAPVNPGDSGGPVMNERGEIVGVVSHFNTKARQVSGNIDVEDLRKFLARHTPRTLPKELVGEKEAEPSKPEPTKSAPKAPAPRP